MKTRTIFSTSLLTILGVLTFLPTFSCSAGGSSVDDEQLDNLLSQTLRDAGFSGLIGQSIENKLGRKINSDLSETGRMLWFDSITGLNNDNSCGGCHSPSNGFGDTQSIAIGIDNNGIVGPNRTGPRNQRRTPMAINSAFYPALMWNSRFEALSGDPFNNRSGFKFPDPDGMSLSNLPHLLVAQAFIPPTERNEVAGFHFPGGSKEIRDEVLKRLNGNSNYRQLFSKNFPDVLNGKPITFDMFGLAIAEFEFTLTFANAPIDQFAVGQRSAMSRDQKLGALLFFGKANCVSCHAVGGRSNEMFSDFKNHVAAVPQIAPSITNSVFDGSGLNEDFGMEQVTGNNADRYKFRTSPLRNVGLQPAFFHNGAFVDLEKAVKFHINTIKSAREFSPSGLDSDLSAGTGPVEPVLTRLDPLLINPVSLTDGEIQQLLVFIKDGLTDPRARSEHLRSLIPNRLPSGRPVARFE